MDDWRPVYTDRWIRFVAVGDGVLEIAIGLFGLVLLVSGMHGLVVSPDVTPLGIGCVGAYLATRSVRNVRRSWEQVRAAVRQVEGPASDIVTKPGGTRLTMHLYFSVDGEPFCIPLRHPWPQLSGRRVRVSYYPRSREVACVETRG